MDPTIPPPASYATPAPERRTAPPPPVVPEEPKPGAIRAGGVIIEKQVTQGSSLDFPELGEIDRFMKGKLF
jgi:hypothetical protein